MLIDWTRVHRLFLGLDVLVSSAHRVAIGLRILDTFGHIDTEKRGYMEAEVASLSSESRALRFGFGWGASAVAVATGHWTLDFGPWHQEILSTDEVGRCF